jgi:hypothetical protein
MVQTTAHVRLKIESSTFEQNIPSCTKFETFWRKISFRSVPSAARRDGGQCPLVRKRAVNTAGAVMVTQFLWIGE